MCVQRFDGVIELMNDLEFHILQSTFFARQQQLLVADLGQLAAEAKRYLRFQPQPKLLAVPSEQMVDRIRWKRRVDLRVLGDERIPGT